MKILRNVATVSCECRVARGPTLLDYARQAKRTRRVPSFVPTLPPGCYSLAALRLGTTCFVFIFADRYAFHMLVPPIAITRDATKEIRDEALLRGGANYCYANASVVKIIGIVIIRDGDDRRRCFECSPDARALYYWTWIIRLFLHCRAAWRCINKDDQGEPL